MAPWRGPANIWIKGRSALKRSTKVKQLGSDPNYAFSRDGTLPKANSIMR